MPVWSNLSFQNSNSPLMEHLIFFHDHSMIILLSITFISAQLMISSMLSKNFNKFFLESQNMELFWTSIPALMLAFIAMPSLKTLYMMEENIKPSLSIKAMGYQWFWGYEYSNKKNLKFTSNILNNSKLFLMDTSNHLIIPIKTSTRMMISSKDVIHSWTIPSLGIKADAVPGRMNQILILINRPSMMIGQCSEICGAGHSFMPITIESPSIKNFIKNV